MGWASSHQALKESCKIIGATFVKNLPNLATSHSPVRLPWHSDGNCYHLVHRASATDPCPRFCNGAATRREIPCPKKLDFVMLLQLAASCPKKHHALAHTHPGPQPTQKTMKTTIWTMLSGRRNSQCGGISTETLNVEASVLKLSMWRPQY